MRTRIITTTVGITMTRGMINEIIKIRILTKKMKNSIQMIAMKGVKGKMKGKYQKIRL